MDKSFVISSIKFKNIEKEIEVFDDTILSTELLFIPKAPLSDEYSIYSKIEDHMELSGELYHLFKQTQSIIASLQKSKPIYAKSHLTTILKDVISVSSYSSLINTLDEVLFNDCGSLETFWVQDNEYKLESLYYKQESWSNDVNIHDVQTYHFNIDDKLSMDESMHLILICKKWLQCFYNASNISNNKRLTTIIQRLTKKIEHCLHYICDNFDKENPDEDVRLVAEMKEKYISDNVRESHSNHL